MHRVRRVPGIAWLARASRRGVLRPIAPALLDDLLIMSGSLLAVGCWLALYRWYSIYDHYETPFFAFDKIPGHFASPILRYTLALFVVLILIYVSNYYLIKKTSTLSLRLKLAMILISIGSGLVNIFLYPVAAIDLFYYINELKIAYHYNQNPYLVTFVPSFASDPFARFGWPSHVPLAYGPAWLVLSWVPVAFAGFQSLLGILLAYKIFSFVAFLLCGVVIAMGHDDEKSRWLGTYAFLANPLVVFEAIGNAHNDILMTLFLLAAVVALERGSWATIPLATMAGLVKVFAAGLIPLFLLAMWTRKWKWATIIWSVVLALPLAAALVAPFWAEGRMVSGMVRAMSFANNLKTASLSSLAKAVLDQRQASPEAVSSMKLIFGVLFVAATLLIGWRVRRLERALACTLLLLFTLVGSIQPWYWIPVAALLAMDQDWLGFGYLAVASTLGIVIYLVDVWARFNSGLALLERHVLGALLLNLPLLAFVGLEIWHGPPIQPENKNGDLS